MPLQLKKYTRSPNWFIRGTYQKIYVFETTGTPVRSLAQAKLDNLIGEINDGTFNKRRRFTFGEAAVAYREAGRSSRYLGEEADGQWTGVLGQFLDTPLDSIGQKELDTAAKAVYPDVKPQTLNRQFYTPFIAVWNFAANEKMCAERSWSRPKEKKSDKKKRAWFRKPETAAKLFDKLPWHLRALFIFYLYTGARITEAIELEIPDLYLEENWAVLNATKTEALRGVPLRPLVVKVLRWYIGDRKAGRVFLTHHGKPYEGRRRPDGTVEDSGYFKTSWNASIEAAGLSGEGLTPYSMRHTFNNWLIRAGVEKEHREALMGHTDESTNAIYSDVPQEELIRIVSELPDFTDFTHPSPLNPSLFTRSSSITEAATRMRELRKERKDKGLDRNGKSFEHTN